MKKYIMKDDNFVSAEEGNNINVEIQNITPKQLEHKTKAQLMEMSEGPWKTKFANS